MKYFEPKPGESGVMGGDMGIMTTGRFALVSGFWRFAAHAGMVYRMVNLGYYSFIMPAFISLTAQHYQSIQ